VTGIGARYRVLGLLALISIQISNAHAQRLISGEEMVLPCKGALSTEDAGTLEYSKIAFCVGAITAIAWTAPHLEQGARFCIPFDATRALSVEVVVRYLEMHTDRLQEDFFLLAFQALRGAWPCPAYEP
jgi:hypothetical protein